MITDTAEWQILRIKELGEAADNIKKEISRITQLSEKEVEQLFFDSAQMSTSFYDDIYKASGLPPTPLAENKSLMQLLDAGIKQTNQELKNFTQSLGFAVDVAGQTVFKPIAKVYQDTLDFAQFQVSSGAVDYITATRQAVKKLADSGVRFVDYKTGWVNRADVAVRRATLTGIGQVVGKISEQTATDLDTDIVETTAHMGARPDHKEWQGKWFSLSGKSDKYPSLVAVTGYGKGAGLKGWNCRHDFFPVVPGISEPAYSDEDLKNIDPPPFEYEGKTYTAYEASQQQRIIETAMRKSKRELIGFEASGDKEAFTTSSIKLRRQKELYSEFSKKAGLKTQLERTQEFGFDRSKAQKAAWNAKKAVDNKVESGIIKERNKYQSSAEKHPTSQDEIDNILKGPLNNVKMSADVLYNPRLRTSYGQTKYTLTHKVKINAIEVGKQGKPGTTEIIDTIIHEELEARILKRAYNKHIQKYIIMDKLGEKGTHKYILPRVYRFLRMKGLK